MSPARSTGTPISIVREARRPQIPADGLELESGAEDLKATSRGDLALNPGGGVLGEFSGVLQIELPFDLLTIILNGLDTQVQFFRNIARFFPLADQLEDFQLAVAEAFYRRFVDIVLTADLLLEHLCREAIANVNGPSQDSPNGRQNLFQRLFLHEVTQGTCAESDFGINRFVVHAYHQHWQPGILRFNVAHQLQSTAVFERNVRYYQVRLEPVDGVHGAGRIFLLTAHDKVGLAIYELGDAKAHHRVIIHQQDPRAVVLHVSLFGLSHGVQFCLQFRLQCWA